MLYEVPLPLKSLTLNSYQNIEKSTIYGDLKSKKKKKLSKEKNVDVDTAWGLWGTQGVSWGRTQVQNYAGQFATTNLSVLQKALRENNLFFLLFPAIFGGGDRTEGCFPL